MTALLVVAGIWVALNVNLMPAEASTRAALVDQLFRAMLGLAAVIFLLVEGLLLYSVFRFVVRQHEAQRTHDVRRGADDDLALPQ